MITEDFITAVSGPPRTPNTSVSKDVGLFCHTLRPSPTIKATFKKSSCPPGGLAVSATHVFAAQADKAHVHVYSRQRGSMEALVPVPERVRCLSLQGDVLLLGTEGGRLMLWELCTGRQLVTPACHVRAVTCLASTPSHVLSGSEDSNVNVWPLFPLLDLQSSLTAGSRHDLEPERVFSNHRGSLVALALVPSTNPETAICVSAARDKTCIVWNYHTGAALRTLLLATPPLCLALDPCARAIVLGCENMGMYRVELTVPGRELLGPRSAEGAETAVRAGSPMGVADVDAGPASCVAISYDGTILLSGHAKGKILQWDLCGSEGTGSTGGVLSHGAEVADLNAAVTNVSFISLFEEEKMTRTPIVVKPTLAPRGYTFTAQLIGNLEGPSALDRAVETLGFPSDMFAMAIAAMATRNSEKNRDESQIEIGERSEKEEELWDIIREQRALQAATFEKYVEVNREK